MGLVAGRPARQLWRGAELWLSGAGRCPSVSGRRTGDSAGGEGCGGGGKESSIHRLRRSFACTVRGGRRLGATSVTASAGGDPGGARYCTLAPDQCRALCLYPPAREGTRRPRSRPR
eukprot:scaffold1418_cov352-Prasinococcus_capsulatus_cf.AAC.12